MFTQKELRDMFNKMRKPNINYDAYRIDDSFNSFYKLATNEDGQEYYAFESKIPHYVLDKYKTDKRRIEEMLFIEFCK